MNKSSFVILTGDLECSHAHKSIDQYLAEFWVYLAT